MSNLFKGAALFAGGALVGAAAALLLTTKKGEEIRHELSDLVDEWKNGKKPASNQPAKEEA
jgi:gas vesicle protein